MHVYGSLASPFVQRVMMTARLKGVELDVQPAPGGTGSESFKAISPAGRIPLLVTDEGEHICESAAIAAYLDEILPGPSLMPATPLARARVQELAAIAYGEIAAGVRPMLVHLIFVPGGPEAVVAAGRAQAALGFAALDRLLAAHQRYAVGDRIGAADCALVPVLHLARLVGPAVGTADLLDQAGNVSRYLATIGDEPQAARVMREMDEHFAAVIERVRAIAAASPAAERPA
ncbi:glutathione S-transferase family protein [Sphingomonas ginkgonis]|uniref:Glutathione S-transferase family protein n=1 Tax=Sphingomonas ginkgonis TaxID=2315330 RepID=A0A429VDV2_9SPHN|nr:glutathione S-transferase family protein [Sphingomonas ginkgonis]RST32012.1 glutathione S-transferase family protein [Sphingomonas ginkgonis]